VEGRSGPSGVTAAQGFLAGSVYAGIKSGGRDLTLLYSERPCAAAAVFTTNAVRSPAVQVSAPRFARGGVRAVIANSGNANACTGQQGIANAERMAELAARKLGLGRPEEVAVCSTGIIGIQLPMDRIAPAIETIRPSR
jgi:glutamate N-acetyltransferase/amino-acid N-acetyltransferase